MNNGDQAVTLIFLFGCIVLVASSLLVRRLPVGQTLKMILAWLLIFAGLFAVFALRDDFLALGQRILGDATGATVQETKGGELRIRRAEDGHFWVDAEINGRTERFLVDSGATVTTVGSTLAAEAKLPNSGAHDQMVRTGNGIVQVSSATADSLMVGSIDRRDQPVYIADNDDVNVIGMSYLSSLSRWSVEGRWLILQP